MRYPYCFLIIVIGILLSGCARLSVSVEVLNSAYWASPEYVDLVTLRKIVDAEQSIHDGRFEKFRVYQKAVAKRALVKLSEIPPPGPNTPRLVEPNMIDGLLAGFDNYIDKIIMEASEYYSAAFDEVSSAGRVTNDAKALYTKGVEKITPITNELRNFLQTRIDQGLEGQRTIMSQGKPDTTNVLDEQENKMSQNKQYADKVVSQSVREADAGSGYILGAGILNDPRASAVVYAHCKYWKGQFNQTVCYGQFGNTDCAVKMESIGDFTLKGVRLDASKITQATFSVAKEAIQVVAAVYGVPLPKGQQAVAAPDVQTSDSLAAEEITSPGKRQLDAETAILQLRLARLAMFESIVTQRQSIDDAAKREQAIKTIKQTLEVNSKELYPAIAQ